METKPPAAVVSRLPERLASRYLPASSIRITRCGSKRAWTITACASALAIAAKAVRNSLGPPISIGSIRTPAVPAAGGRTVSSAARLAASSKGHSPVGVKKTQVDQRLLRPQPPQPALGVGEPAFGRAPARGFHAPAEMELAVMYGHSGEEHQCMIGNGVLD